MADSPGPCVKASTHSSIHPFFFHLSFHLLSHPSIGPHPPIIPPPYPPPFCLQHPSIITCSTSFFLSAPVSCHLSMAWVKVAPKFSLPSFFFLFTSSVSFTKDPDWANCFSAPGASDHWDHGCGSPDGEAPGGQSVWQLWSEYVSNWIHVKICECDKRANSSAGTEWMNHSVALCDRKWINRYFWYSSNNNSRNVSGSRLSTVKLFCFSQSFTTVDITPQCSGLLLGNNKTFARNVTQILFKAFFNISWLFIEGRIYCLIQK